MGSLWRAWAGAGLVLAILLGSNDTLPGEPHPQPLALTQADQENLRYLWAKFFEEAEENGWLILIKEHHPQPLALSQADQENLRYLWAKLFEEAEDNGRLILIRFFTDHPESKQYFKRIPTEGAYQNNPLLAFHARRVMAALNQVFENIGNWQQVHKLLGCVVDSHKNVHRVPVAMFQTMFGSMLRTAQDLLQNAFTDDMLVSWEKLFGALYEEIAAAYGRNPHS